MSEMNAEKINVKKLTNTESNRLEAIDKSIKSYKRKIAVLERELQELETERQTLMDRIQLYNSVTRSRNNEWTEETFEWSKKARKILKETFHLNDYRPQQLAAINGTMKGCDLLLIAPTGGGKSLCYQLPALLDDNGFTLIVSPLVSLMQDQVMQLHELKIPAEYVSMDNFKDIVKLLKSDNAGGIKLLYATPERIEKSKTFKSALQRAYEHKQLRRIAIDEVHCCSQWGHDFRPDYKCLSSFKHLFPDCPIMGVTATATSNVLIDVQKMLNITDGMILRAPFNRPNLYYHCLEKPKAKSELYDLLADLIKRRYNDMSGIIYTLSISETETIASELQERGISKIHCYHGSLVAATRTRVHRKWLSGEYKIVVATIAFGLGINKPDVRFVIHNTISKSIENYYQESGRAGRDGNPAECLLLYRFGDIFNITTMTFFEHNGLRNAYAMINYAFNITDCRRTLLAKYFVDVWAETNCNEMCDRCRNNRNNINNNRNDIQRLNITEIYESLCELIKDKRREGERLTGLQLIDQWLKFRKNQLKDPALRRQTLGNISRKLLECIIVKLLIENYLREDLIYTAYTSISYMAIGPTTAADESNLTLDFRETPIRLPSTTETIEIWNKKHNVDDKGGSHKKDIIISNNNDDDDEDDIPLKRLCTESNELKQRDVLETPETILIDDD